MNDLSILILTSIVLLFIIFPLLFFLRKRVELKIEKDKLILEYPLSTKEIDMKKELESWSVERYYYIRWGVFHSITMIFKNGKRLAVNSLMNQENYDLLYDYLASRFQERKK